MSWGELNFAPWLQSIVANVDPSLYWWYLLFIILPLL